MKVLVIGGGGREHALAWKLKQSHLVWEIFCTPGNAGTSGIASNVSIHVSDLEKLREFALINEIDLTVVGPELPLVKGIAEVFSDKGLNIFAPNARAAEIEGNKAFAKEFMRKYDIPTAEFEIFEDVRPALEFVRKVGAPVVVKASGLAEGKGVLICRNLEEAFSAVRFIMEEKAFGKAGEKIIIEEYLEGEEVSFLAFSDGKSILPMVSSQDHKAIFDGDKGPNTGGMGAYSPAPMLTSELVGITVDSIIKPVVEGLAKEGREYRGVIYAGLMIKDKSVKVLEFNARFGDPETQVILPRMKSDIVPILLAVTEGRLNEVDLQWKEDGAAVCVVMTSSGYPGKYERGQEISGIEQAEQLPGVAVFHAGTSYADGKVVTNGGRVLGVTALESDIPQAIRKAYMAATRISWTGAYYRKDIGQKALKWLNRT